MARFERVFLYVVVLALAIMVGFLAHKTECPSEDGCSKSLNGGELLSQVAEQVSALASGLGQLREMVRSMGESQGTLIRSELERIAPQIADLVYARLRQEGACPSPAGSCPEPKPASVVGNFTFLYENARLNDAQKVTVESVGVKLAPRHERRLAMLERAFLPCQRDGAKVTFQVTGYSSTAEFQEEGPTGDRRPLKNSNELNLTTANLRAEVVATHLQQAGFEADPTAWESFEVLRRPYLDDSLPGDDQQALNRSVFIHVDDAGTCHIDRLAPPVQP